MKKLTVTLKHLEQIKGGITRGAYVSFRVIQSGRVLVEDVISGKITTEYRKTYCVEGTDDPLIVEHNRGGLPRLVLRLNAWPA